MLDRVGALVSAGLVPKDLLFASHREMIIRSWEKLAPYVRHSRLHRYPSFASYFEELASMARNHQAATPNEAVLEPSSPEQQVNGGLRPRRPSWALPALTQIGILAEIFAE